MAIGEDRVRLSFNPSARKDVELFKLKTAELINMCETLRLANGLREEDRLWVLAQDAYENAAMWAVKAATFIDN